MQNVFRVDDWGINGSELSSAGKRQRDARRGQQASPLVCEGPAVSKVVTIAAIEIKVATLTGKLGGATVTSCWIRALQSHW